MRSRLAGLPPAAQTRALEWLRGFHFTEQDLSSLHADAEGGIYYVCDLDGPFVSESDVPPIAEAEVPISPFPSSLIFHSRPGSTNILFLNFAGETVTNTQWNTTLGRTEIPAVAFSTDANFSTFSDAEQVAIKRIWERISEDYVPWDVDVTTERPATFTKRTAQALITRNTDANTNANPSSTAGGVAYVNVFGSTSFATYRPAWIYYNNLASAESYIAEAASHELGHNMGLSHDGTYVGTTTNAYYSGHGSGNISWAPIMGTAYGKSVSQWSMGEYYTANNSQDDLLIIAGKMVYRADDRGDTLAAATALQLTGGTNIVSTTPETDPTNTNTANKGVLESNTDVDVFSFNTGTGAVQLTVNPWISPASTRGGNVDVTLELYNEGGTLLLTNNPATDTTALIATNLTQGRYYIYVRNSAAGDPWSSTPTGYTSYGGLGQYFLSGYVTAVISNVTLAITANNPAWGTVAPTNGSYTAGSTLQLSATPATYYQFNQWSGGLSGTANPFTLVLNTNLSATAVFGEILTTNHPTPYWWLAANGYTNNFERAVTNIGLNGIQLWQSYIAGLNPADPASQLRVAGRLTANKTGVVLQWNTVTGRVYTVLSSTNLSQVFTPLTGASNLSWTIQSLTNTLTGAPQKFYRIQVQKL